MMKHNALICVLILSTASIATADVFTAAKTDANNPSGWRYYIGQTFTPNIQLPHGTGTIPEGTETVYLHSFRVFPWAPEYDPTPVPDKAYLYPASLLPLDSDMAEVGLYSLAEGTHVGDGLYEFDPVELDVDGSYAFFLTQAASVLYWESSSYEGGESYWTNESTVGSTQEIFDFHSDLDFVATFSTDGIIPEPATLSLLGLGGLAVIRRRRSR